MTNNLLSVVDAASLIGKSAQTVRRMIKNKKIKFRRKKTPQGFTYFIDQESLLTLRVEEENKPVKKSAASAEVFEANAVSAGEIKKRGVTEKFEAAGVEAKDIFNLDKAVKAKTIAENAGLKDLPEEERPAVSELETGAWTGDARAEEIQEPEVDFGYLVDENVPAEKAHPQKEKSKLTNQNKTASQPDFENQFIHFSHTLQQLITQYERLLKSQEEDKKHLYSLVETFQARIGVLENRIKQLEAPKSKKWWQFWK